jgi:transposase InsO family protein
MKVVHPGEDWEAVVATPINCSPEGPWMNIHKNARLTPQGRFLMVRRIEEEGWKVADAAVAAGISKRRAHEWLRRYRAGGEIALDDRSSTPARYRDRTISERDAEIERLRRQRLTGDRIARRLGLPRSTVGAVLRRLGLGHLERLNPPLPAVRYQRERPGELVHLDTKKLGRIDGIGHRITGRRPGAINRHRGIGWEALHVAIDDASRLAYTELLPDEKKESAMAFLGRALDWFARHGVAVQRIMTDNGPAYRSHDFRQRLARLTIKHIRTRPYTPRTNGKAERFIQTSLREWAYARPYRSSDERGQAMHPWIANYNLSRPHSALGGKPPAAKLNNLLGFNN